MKMFLFFLTFPDAECDEENRNNDNGTECTEWTENSNNDFLGNHISIETDSTSREDSEYFRWASFFREPSDKCYDEENRIDNECNHRECYFEVSDCENNRTRILEDSTTWERRIDVTWERLEYSSVGSVPVLVCRNREFNRVEDTDSSENGDDEILTHRREREEIKDFNDNR